MKILPALSTLLAVVAAVAQPEGALPAYMLGRYVLQTSEGFSDFMYRIDIGWFQRAVSEEGVNNHIFTSFSPDSLFPVPRAGVQPGPCHGGDHGGHSHHIQVLLLFLLSQHSVHGKQ